MRFFFVLAAGGFSLLLAACASNAVPEESRPGVHIDCARVLLCDGNGETKSSVAYPLDSPYPVLLQTWEKTLDDVGKENSAPLDSAQTRALCILEGQGLTVLFCREITIFHFEGAAGTMVFSRPATLEDKLMRGVLTELFKVRSRGDA